METVSGVANAYEVQTNGKHRAWLDAAKYHAMYKRSVEDPNGFWGDAGRRLDWMRPYTKVKNTSFDPGIRVSDRSPRLNDHICKLPAAFIEPHIVEAIALEADVHRASATMRKPQPRSAAHSR